MQADAVSGVIDVSQGSYRGPSTQVVAGGLPGCEPAVVAERTAFPLAVARAGGPYRAQMQRLRLGLLRRHPAFGVGAPAPTEADVRRETAGARGTGQ